MAATAASLLPALAQPTCLVLRIHAIVDFRQGQRLKLLMICAVLVRVATTDDSLDVAPSTQQLLPHRRLLADVYVSKMTICECVVAAAGLMWIYAL